jgi:hypothetical protein
MLGTAILILAVVFVARHDEKYSTRGTGYDIKCKQTSQPATAMGSFVCAIDHSQNSERDEIGPPWWHEFFAWPEGITALLLLLTLGAVLWQAWETRKAADATRDSVKLQEVAYKQWVEIDTWENRTPHLQPTTKDATIRLTFQITNYTTWPFVLKRVTTQKGVANTVITMKHIVSPGDWYVGDISFDVTLAELSLYWINKLAVTVVIDTEIRNVLERPRPDHFVHTIMLGPTRCDMTEVQHYSGQNPS